MDQLLIIRIVEAALLAANQPLTLAQLHGLFPEDEPAPADSVEQALEHLQQACADRGVELVEVASGFRYQVKADVHGWVSRLWTERKTKYTRATLETLALIAYRQPITRGEIEQVRGVAVSSNIIQALEEREWIRVVGHRDVPGKPALFGTTRTFLDYFGLKRLDELPPLSELKDIGELEPQLALDDVPLPAGIASGGTGAAADAAQSGHGDDVPARSVDETGDDDSDNESDNAPASDTLQTETQDAENSTTDAEAALQQDDSIDDLDAHEDEDDHEDAAPAETATADSDHSDPTQDDVAADSEQEDQAPSEQNP